MENFSFRPFPEADRAHNAFLPPSNFENFASPFFGAQDFSRARLNPNETQAFLPFPKEEGLFANMHDHMKTEGFALDNHAFLPLPQGNLDASHDNAMLAKPQDYNMEYYRINRSRGPSFNLGHGRKTSEDFFAHGFDLLNYFTRNQDQQQQQHHHHRERLFSLDGIESQAQNGFLGNAALGNFAMLAENILQYNVPTALHENNAVRDNQGQAGQYAFHQQADQTVDQQDTQDSSDYESINKKQKLNNAQESVVLQPSQLLATIQAKKPKAGAQESESKDSKAKPDSKKSATPKTKGKKAAVDNSDKSTQPSVNVSPNPKKEDIFNPNNMVGNFGTFKKPETAQELLGGLSVPAEVEEYINNSKIFNQIKAPVIRKIGTLTVEERKIKIDKYLEKRKRRTWNKRVNYDCRKKVADNRLRIKGRFVTKDQAFSMLEAFGIPFDPETITNTEIKEILTEKFGGIIPKKKNLGEVQDAKDRIGMTLPANPAGSMFNFGDFGVEDGAASFGSQDD